MEISRFPRPGLKLLLVFLFIVGALVAFLRRGAAEDPVDGEMLALGAASPEATAPPAGPAEAGPAAAGAEDAGRRPGPPSGLPGPPGDGRAGIAVHVAGAVVRPGVYRLAEGDRVVDALLQAGGAASDGRPDLVNLAARLEDGQRIYIPSEKDVRVMASGGVPQGVRPWEAGDAAATPGGGQAGVRAGRVSLNRAGVAELDTLPGIGPSLAQRIVDHRRSHGPFRRLEDLRQVSGIGPSKFEQIKGYLSLD